MHVDLYVKWFLLCGFDLKVIMNFSLSNLMKVRSVIFQFFLMTDGRTVCAPQRLLARPTEGEEALAKY